MKVIFLDRDDTLNEDPGYLNDPLKLRLLPHVVEGLGRLQAAGYHFIILTNQSGVGRGLITHDQLDAVHRRLCAILEGHGITILDIFSCLHHPDEDCNCRKPKPDLLRQACERFPDIDLKHSWVIGDRLRDIAIGEAGLPQHQRVAGILVGHKDDDMAAPDNLRYRVADLNEAADRILQSQPATP